MKPTLPPWIIENVGSQREERADRGRARLKIPLPPPRQDTREQPPSPEVVIIIEPFTARRVQ